MDRSRGTLLLTLALTLFACDAVAPDRAAAPRSAGAGAGACDDGSAPASALAGVEDELEVAARLAVAGDADERQRAIERLRGAGPRGLEVFTRVHADALASGSEAAPVIDRRVASTSTSSLAPGLGLGGALLGGIGIGSDPGRRDAASEPSAAIDAAIDAICRQHGCRHTGLYWFTDLEAAKAEARASGRPILSLRLLGDLGEALSCANSRLFRTILYPALRSTLRERFVLHWSSERPAPVITIDFGDGRRLTRTITGNSVHFVLDAEGRPVDAIPGLMPPPVFERLSERAAALALRTQGRWGGERAALLREHHQGRLAELEAAWAAELRAIGEDPSDMPLGTGVRGRLRRPAAREAMPLAISKMKIEAPMLGGLGELGGGAREPLAPAIWERLGVRHRGEARLQPASLRAMAALEETSPAMIAASEVSLAIDGVRSEYELHREIHRWFAGDEVGDLPALARRIYDELFLTPATDPNLGLAPPEVFAGLPAGGWTGTPGRE